jgi:hypothetical protein
VADPVDLISALLWDALNQSEAEFHRVAHSLALWRSVGLIGDLVDRALRLLRSDEWVAEGFRPGASAPELVERAWWRRDVSLDLLAGEAEWNGVRYVGIKVRRVSPEPAPVPKPARTRDRVVAEMVRDYPTKAALEAEKQTGLIERYNVGTGTVRAARKIAMSILGH